MNDTERLERLVLDIANRMPDAARLAPSLQLVFDQLKAIQGTLNVCGVCLIILTILAASTAWKVFG
jgi:hypothetical protein